MVCPLRIKNLNKPTTTTLPRTAKASPSNLKCGSTASHNNLDLNVRFNAPSQNLVRKLTKISPLKSKMSPICSLQ